MRVTRIMAERDRFLWRTWRAMTVPEGFRAEIIDGSIVLSPMGGRRHAVLANRLRDALTEHLANGPLAAYTAGTVVSGRELYMPDVFVAPDDVDRVGDADGIGVLASGVVFVAEVVCPERPAGERDRKRRAYARAGIGAYVIVDDSDGDGVVTVLGAPNVAGGTYGLETRAAYGVPVGVAGGPLEGFVVGADITLRRVPGRG
ncbi:Uma2 family endonuclease [Embleya sp. NPDC001921]